MVLKQLKTLQINNRGSHCGFQFASAGACRAVVVDWPPRTLYGERLKLILHKFKNSAGTAKLHPCRFKFTANVSIFACLYFCKFRGECLALTLSKYSILYFLYSRETVVYEPVGFAGEWLAILLAYINRHTTNLYNNYELGW